MTWVGSIPGGKVPNYRIMFLAKTTKALVEDCKGKGFTVTASALATYLEVTFWHADIFQSRTTRASVQYCTTTLPHTPREYGWAAADET